MIHARSFAVFDSKSTTSSLPELLARLLDEQKRTWPQLSAGYSSLTSVRLREIRCSGYSVWLQFNPGRIVSTGARVDAESIRERRCFLCVENLPAPQKGILYKDDFLVLCNPAPIFPEHFTISHIDHIAQAFSSSVTTFLDLARDLSPRLTVFYNGPKCGASAPDHLHFQASPAGTIPVEKEASEGERRLHRKNVRGVEIFTLANYGRQLIILESGQSSSLEGVLFDLLDSLRTVIGANEEPMMNVLCSYGDCEWRVVLFPRSKHRPDAYYKEGKEQILVSPAAVDIGGLIITPLEKDFNSVNAETVEDIFREVSLPSAKVDEVLEMLS